MERLPHEPRNFRELVEADLRRAARLIIKVQDELDPQFRVASPEGDYWLAINFPSDVEGRKDLLDKIALFMAWKQSLAFTLATELIQPDAIYCLGVGVKERYGCISRIKREPRPWTSANFGEVEWLSESSIEPVFVELLPKGVREITANDMMTLEVVR